MTTIHAPLADLERFIRDGIPLARAMDLRIAAFDGDRLTMTAPLAPNINDKGCAFGGSLASLMTLAAWGLVTMQCRRAALPADVFVADSQVRFLKPLFGDLDACARIAEGDAWSGFLATLRGRGRARVNMAMTVATPDGGVATSASARYVAIAKR